MKQLEMTPALEAMIREAIGPDASIDGFAVFESISLNTRPLPGKRGTLFEDATVSPSTLKLMVDHINSGNHLPLIADHDLMGAPKGRVFHAGLDFSEESGVELRTLFYLDQTEDELIAKLNAGSLDEVSVSFLAEKFLCSECSWDYFEGGRMEAVWEKTCGNGHKIGTDGIHGEMFGLRAFIELSLVASGAADKPKIVGKSQAKLAPETKQLLTASGYDEPDQLVLRASIKKEDSDMADAELMTRLSTLSTEKGELTVKLSAAETRATTAEGQVTALKTERDDLATKLATAEKERDEALAASNAEDYAAAIKGFQTQLNALRVAGGEAELSEADLPKTVAELIADIDSKTAALTALLPAPGGRSKDSNNTAEDGTAKFNAEAYKLRA
jgi:hypothetical protein